MAGKVTIVTLVYNVEKYFERCLRSIFEQNYENIEYLIVNNCSTDNSMGVLEQVLQDYPYRKNQVVIQNNERNMGYCYSINKGFELATGEFVTFVDSDDWLEPGSIRKCVDLMVKSNYDILHFENYIDKYTGRVRRPNKVKEDASNIDCVNAMLASQLIMEGTFWTKFYRNDFLKRASLSLMPDCPPWSDMCFNVRLFALTEKVGLLREPLYHYCENEGQTVKSWNTSRENSLKRITQETRNLRQVEDQLEKLGLLEKCIESLNLRKLSFKSDNLVFFDRQSVEDWINTFPEINEFAICSPKIRRIDRIMNKLLLKRYFLTYKSLLLTRRICGKVKRILMG